MAVLPSSIHVTKLILYTCIFAPTHQDSYLLHRALIIAPSLLFRPRQRQRGHDIPRELGDEHSRSRYRATIDASMIPHFASLCLFWNWPLIQLPILSFRIDEFDISIWIISIDLLFGAFDSFLVLSVVANDFFLCSKAFRLLRNFIVDSCWRVNFLILALYHLWKKNNFKNGNLKLFPSSAHFL